jgi:CsoR family transcriptional regulator, copper-sensing transcriptional repressor
VVEQDTGRDPEDHWEQRLALPVIIAALASVPAVFLTLLDRPYETVGNVVNWLSGAVLVAETVVLFVVSRDKWEWVRRHKWLLLLTVFVILGVVLAIGPVQLLRLLRVVGALRLVRAGRIIKAARITRDKLGLPGQWSKVSSAAAALLVAAFVGVVLADPTSRSRQLVDQWLGGGTSQVVLSVLAGAVLAVATFVVVRSQQRNRSE